MTGYGVLGHLHTMVVASDVAARLTAKSVPVFDGVRKLIEKGIVPGGTKRNLTANTEYTTWGAELGNTDQLLLADAQTSGGLLIAVDSAQTDALLAALQREETPVAAVIGEVVEGEAGTIEVM